MDAAIHFDEGLVVVRTTGTARARTLEDIVGVVVDDPRFEIGMPMLFDHSELAVGELNAYDIRGIAEAFLSREDDLGHGRKAIVVPGDAAYGLARMFAVYAESDRLHVAVFRDRESAVAWLMET